MNKKDKVKCKLCALYFKPRFIEMKEGETEKQAKLRHVEKHHPLLWKKFFTVKRCLFCTLLMNKSNTIEVKEGDTENQSRERHIKKEHPLITKWFFNDE